MTYRICIALLVACLSGAIALAADKKEDKPKDAPSTQPVNKMCAVDQEHEADPKVTTVYKEQTIAFCCKDCIPAFKKDPEKYVKTMK